MRTVEIEARAKVNLGLEVLAKRDDGYHDIDTIFQTISLSDTLRLSPSPDGTISLETSGIPVPGGPANLAVRAAEAIVAASGCRGPAISLEKRIPVGAGLGGGSADAAAVLVGMDALFGLGLPAHALLGLALSIGSDVPFLIRGGTSRGRGRGEILERLSPLAGLWFVLVTPPFEVSAGEAYRRARIRLTGRSPFIRLNCSAIQNGDPEALARGLENDLEAGVVSSYPEVGQAKARLLESGAMAAVMSGSGSTVVGIARTEEDAHNIESRLAGRDWLIHVAEPIDAGCTIRHEGAASERASS